MTTEVRPATCGAGRDKAAAAQLEEEAETTDATLGREAALRSFRRFFGGRDALDSAATGTEGIGTLPFTADAL